MQGLSSRRAGHLKLICEQQNRAKKLVTAYVELDAMMITLPYFATLIYS